MQPLSLRTQGTVLVVGGYGTVGSLLAARLARLGDVHTVVAGRDQRRAEAVAASLPGASARRVDLDDEDTWSAALLGVEVVVVCIDQISTRFVAHVLNAGIHYVDVTASDSFFRAVEALPRTSQATALLSIGLAPGLSNLLAITAASQLDQPERIEIGLLMGLGDKHGKAAIEWSVRQTFAPRPDHDHVRIDFGPGFGERSAYFMDFSDQHALMRTLPNVQVSTHVAYDSRLATTALFFLGRVFTGNHFVMRAAAWSAQHLAFGSDVCVLVVNAYGAHRGQNLRRTAYFRGHREANVTAQFAAIATMKVLEGDLPPGVLHSHHVLDAASVLEQLASTGDAQFDLPTATELS